MPHLARESSSISHLLGPVVNENLQLDDSHHYLQEGQPARDFTSGHLVGVDKILLAGLE